MIYKNIPHTSLGVSSIGFGSWVTGGNNWGQLDDKESIKAITAAIENGITLIDTAPVYGGGHAEEVIGQAIKGRRDKVVLSTKCGLRIDERNRHCLTSDSILFEVTASLKRLGSDHIDIYFCHWPDKDTPIEDTVAALSQLREKGLIRAFGLSNHPVDLVERAAKAGPLSCLQEHYSLLKRDIESEILPCVQRHSLAVFAYAPLGGGILTGKYREPPVFSKRDVRDFFYPFYREPLWSKIQPLVEQLRVIAETRQVTPAQVAIAWTAGRPHVASVLAGARNAQQAVSNAGAGALELTGQETAILTACSDKILAP